MGGRRNSASQQNITLEWSREYDAKTLTLENSLSPSNLKHLYDKELRSYFALAGLSRNLTASRQMVDEAYKRVFSVRVSIEKAMRRSVRNLLNGDSDQLPLLLEGSFFGTSKKQGVSVRMPLLVCNTTSLCGAACYAHDALDATPYAVIRGVLNGCIAELYERGDKTMRCLVIKSLDSSVRRAVRASIAEAERATSTFKRQPRIRFSHVGEIAAFPKFTNALALRVKKVSGGSIVPTIYTRHPKARQLDTRLMVINFTLDKSSLERRSWAPEGSRIVFSAFGGDLNNHSEVNFIEHHRWIHMEPKGLGPVCPTTLPETEVRTCDAVKCDQCFRHPQ